MTTLMLVLLLSAAPAEAPRVLAVVDMTLPHSRTVHNVEFVRADIRLEQFAIGALRLPVAGVRIAPEDHGKIQLYRMHLNGRQVYRAAEVDRGGGFTRSVFLDLESVMRTFVVDIAAASSSAAAVTVSMIRCYPAVEPPSLRDPSSRMRMGLAVLTSTDYGYTLDVSTMR
jgi:hypothetical protein